MIAHMEQKYRMLEVGEVIEAGDEVWRNDGWFKSDCPIGHTIRGISTYRRPVSEVNIHGSGTVSVDAVPQEYRALNPGDVIQEGDEVWEFGKGPWEPVSVPEHGHQYRQGYWKMRRPVAAEKPVVNGCGVAEETITEVREAWQKDHMEMKRKLDAAEKKAAAHLRELDSCKNWWYDQRDELADARNKITDLQKSLEKIENATLRFRGYREVTGHDAVSVLQGLGELIQKRNREITDLTRRLEDALSEKVIAEKRLENLERHVENEHVASWRKIQQVLPESVRNLDLSLVDQVVKCITDLGKVGNAAQNWQDIKVSKNGETHALGTLIPLLESQIASAERQRDNWMETAAQNSRNQEFYHGLVTDIGNMFGLRARISDDGTICEGVLALRVPELVAELIVENS